MGLPVPPYCCFGGGYFTSCSDDDDDEAVPLYDTDVETGVLTDGALTTEKKAISAPDTAGTITVTINDTQEYSGTSIAEAWDAFRDTASGTIVVSLGKGTYTYTSPKADSTEAKDNLTYKGEASITIKGEGDAAYGLDVLIKGHGSKMDKESTRSLMSFQGTANVVLENLTLENSYWNTTGDAQSETLGVGPSAFTGTIAAYNCSFLSGQDTICTLGKAWFYKCYIQGDVDFLWMETKGGVVALYEECVIRAIGDRVKSAYFTAPRLQIQDKVGKGLVIFNSTLEVEDGVDAYLGRNPWASGDSATSYYQQVAIIGTKLYGSLNDAIWKGAANGTLYQRYVGYKTDDHFAASTAGIGTRIGKELVSQEYSDRNVILNRLVDTKALSFVDDTDAKWDVDALKTKNNWE